MDTTTIFAQIHQAQIFPIYKHQNKKIWYLAPYFSTDQAIEFVIKDEQTYHEIIDAAVKSNSFNRNKAWYRSIKTDVLKQTLDFVGVRNQLGTILRDELRAR
jgi:hypothetical protein